MNGPRDGEDGKMARGGPRQSFGTLLKPKCKSLGILRVTVSLEALPSSPEVSVAACLHPQVHSLTTKYSTGSVLILSMHAVSLHLCQKPGRFQDSRRKCGRGWESRRRWRMDDGIRCGAGLLSIGHVGGLVAYAYPRNIRSMENTDWLVCLFVRFVLRDLFSASANVYAEGKVGGSWGCAGAVDGCDNKVTTVKCCHSHHLAVTLLESRSLGEGRGHVAHEVDDVAELLEEYEHEDGVGREAD